jgi:hypothetical protein
MTFFTFMYGFHFKHMNQYFKIIKNLNISGTFQANFENFSSDSGRNNYSCTEAFYRPIGENININK